MRTTTQQTKALRFFNQNIATGSPSSMNDTEWAGGTKDVYAIRNREDGTVWYVICPKQGGVVGAVKRSDWNDSSRA